jgi:hypothetical protein
MQTNDRHSLHNCLQYFLFRYIEYLIGGCQRLHIYIFRRFIIRRGQAGPDVELPFGSHWVDPHDLPHLIDADVGATKGMNQRRNLVWILEQRGGWAKIQKPRLSNAHILYCKDLDNSPCCSVPRGFTLKGGTYLFAGSIGVYVAAFDQTPIHAGHACLPFSPPGW